MFIRMVRQSFLKGWRRKLLAAITVALASALITTLLALSIDVGDKMAREMKSYGSNIRVVPRSENIELSGRDYLAESDLPTLKDIFWSNNVVGFSPFLHVPVRLGGGGETVSFMGTYFNKSVPLPSDEAYRTGAEITHPFWEVEGAWPEDTAPDQAMAGAALAQSRGLSVGDRVSVSFTHEGAESPASLPPERPRMTG